MIKSWVNDLNTTAFRIVASVWIAGLVILALVVAMLFFGWQPSALQLKVLTGIAGVVLTMMGFDVLQFIGKRFSDATYAAAKNPSQPVIVDTPAPVAAPASDGIAVPSAPAPPVAPVPDLSRIPAPEKGP